MLPFVGEGVFVEAFEDNLHLLFKKLFVGIVVDDWGAEGFDLSGLIPSSNSENQPAFGHDVGHGVVLGQTDWVPVGHDVEAAAKLELFGNACQMNAL